MRPSSSHHALFFVVYSKCVVWIWCCFNLVWCVVRFVKVVYCRQHRMDHCLWRRWFWSHHSSRRRATTIGWLVHHACLSAWCAWLSHQDQQPGCQIYRSVGQVWCFADANYIWQEQKKASLCGCRLLWPRAPAAFIMFSLKDIYTALGLTQFNGQSWRWINSGILRWCDWMRCVGYASHLVPSHAM